MSLLERVQRAGNAAKPVEDPHRHADLDALREQVRQVISVDEVAAISAVNPQRARNELRSACRQVFEAPVWASASPAAREELTERLVDEVFGFGPLEGMLRDDTITEIMVNGPFSLFYEQGGRLHRSSQTFSDAAQLRALIDRILGPLGRRIDEASPMVDARLPQGHRVHAVIPPLALDGPLLTIRKFAEHVITLEEMEELGSLPASVRRFLAWAVKARQGIAVSGGTGSGKTTLLNALSCEIPQSERIITIEDSAELRFLEHPHVVRLEARPRNAEGTGEVTIRDLVANALRMRPDRIVVGECRGAEALDMLQAMNTGHDGSLTTLHANSPEEAISRLTMLVRFGADLPVDVIEENISHALDLVVQVERCADGARRIASAAELLFDEEARRCVARPVFVREGKRGDVSWCRVPEWVERLPERGGTATKEEVSSWLASLRWAA